MYTCLISVIMHNSMTSTGCANKKQHTLNVSVFQQWYYGFEPTFRIIWFKRYNSLNFKVHICRTQYIACIIFCRKAANSFYYLLHFQRCKFFHRNCFFISAGCIYHCSLYTAFMISLCTNRWKICSQINYITWHSVAGEGSGVPRSSGQLSLLPSTGVDISIGQRAVMLCGWRVKSEWFINFRRNVWVAGKTVWSC